MYLCLFVLGRNNGDGDRFRVFQNFVVHFARALPVARRLARTGFRRILVAAFRFIFPGRLIRCGFFILGRRFLFRQKIDVEGFANLI